MLTPPSDPTSGLAIDANRLNGLRLAAKQNSPEALKGAAKQFEAMFLNMVFQSMREANPQDSPMDNDQSRMFTSMLDQQRSQVLANRGTGLADALVRQMSRSNGSQTAPAAGDKTTSPTASDGASRVSPGRVGGAAGTNGAGAATRTAARPQSPHVKEFQERLGAQAEQASKATGVPAKFMLGQAALESGWGKREIKMADGSTSHNLFCIKATAGWTGKVVQAPTTEYVNGVPQTRMEKFRAYDSYADAFHDYASLLCKNPRYENVLANSRDATSFAQGLQRAGYATDPHYAAKLTHIINKSLV